VVRRIGSGIAIFALYLLVAVALTWPLAARPGTTVSDPGDPILIAWILDWVAHALTHKPFAVFSPPVFHPSIYPLAYSENMIGIAIPLIPFHLAGASPITLHSLAMLLGFAFAGCGAFALARFMKRSVSASFAAGLFFAFVPYKFSHLSHVQIIWSGWLPLLLLALFAFWNQPTPRRGALLGAAFVMNGLCNIHWLLMGSFAIGVSIVVLVAVHPPREARFWRTLAITAVVSVALLVPVLLPYKVVSDEYRLTRTSGASLAGSATWVDWFVSRRDSPVYGDLPGPGLNRSGRELFPGLIAIFLVAAALLLRVIPSGEPSVKSAPARRTSAGKVRILDAAVVSLLALAYPIAIGDRIRIGSVSFSGADVPLTLAFVALITRFFIAYPRAFGGPEKNLRTTIASSRFTSYEWVAGVWILIGILGSFGENGFLHPFLFRLAEPFRAIRDPARWAVIAYAGIAVWLAMGFDEVLRNRVPRFRRVVAALLLTGMFLEVLPRIPWQHFDPTPEPVHLWMASARPAAVLELPVGKSEYEVRYLMGSAAHRVPLLNGISGWEPPLRHFLRVKSEALAFDDEFLAEIERAGCSAIVVHNEWLGDSADSVNAWLSTNVQNGRLAATGHFAHGARGDDVYTVTKNGKQ
jgi:hypothetical protein